MQANLPRYTHFIIPSEELSHGQIQKMYQLLVAVYPEFKEYYEENRFYSSVKPQLNQLVYADRSLVATGKLLWRKLSLSNSDLLFSGFGLLVRPKYQNQGVGSAMLERFIEEARVRDFDLLYGTTRNPKAVSVMKKFGFHKVLFPVTYTHFRSGERHSVSEDGNAPFILELKTGVTSKYHDLHIGVGPV